MGSCVLLAVKPGSFGGRFSHALALECQPVRVVHEAVENGVGDGRPVLDRQLGRHDCGSAAMPVVDDLQEIARLIERGPGRGPSRRESGDRPVIGSSTAVRGGHRRGRAPRHRTALAGDDRARSDRAGRPVAERAGNPTFAEPGFPDDGQANPQVPADRARAMLGHSDCGSVRR
jgi:hypothetical protein